MVSAGLDTVPGNLIMGLASLAYYPEIQKRAYNDIMSAYPDNDAWDKCLVEEKGKPRLIAANHASQLTPTSCIRYSACERDSALLDSHPHLPTTQVHQTHHVDATRLVNTNRLPSGYNLLHERLRRRLRRDALQRSLHLQSRPLSQRERRRLRYGALCIRCR